MAAGRALASFLVWSPGEWAMRLPGGDQRVVAIVADEEHGRGEVGDEADNFPPCAPRPFPNL